MRWLAITLALLGCKNAERERNHQLVQTQGTPRRWYWEQRGSWIYAPSTITRGDGKAYLWTRFPADRERFPHLRGSDTVYLLVYHQFDCARHLIAEGPMSVWLQHSGADTLHADSLLEESDSATEWSPIPVQVGEPLFQLACAPDQ